MITYHKMYSTFNHKNLGEKISENEYANEYVLYNNDLSNF